MAKYPINNKGLQSLQQLKKTLGNLSEDIRNKGTLLKQETRAQAEELGHFEEDITDLVSNVNDIMEQSQTDIFLLNDLIQKKIEKIERLLQQSVLPAKDGGIFSGNDNGGILEGIKQTIASHINGMGQASAAEQPLDKKLKPCLKSPRDLPATQYSYTEDEEGNYIYDSPKEMNQYLYSKQGSADLHFLGTCGLCSCANILRLAGVNATEKQMITYASQTNSMETGLPLCEKGHFLADMNGATGPKDRKEILAHYGIDSGLFDVAYDSNGEISDSNIQKIEEYVSKGRGVILSVHAKMLRNNAPYGKGDWHAVTVVSVKKDSQGKVLGFYICDSDRRGTVYYPAERVIKSLTGAKINVTHQVIR